MSEIDPTDHALATIASILDQPEPARDGDDPIADDEPLAPDEVTAEGYSKVGPGPMTALRFRWTVHRGDDDRYYVHETIGENSAPVITGPLEAEAAMALVDERERDARQRFEALRSEIAGRGAVADFVRKGSGEA